MKLIDVALTGVLLGYPCWKTWQKRSRWIELMPSEISVVDGDTIRASSLKSSVRLRFIDAPELAQTLRDDWGVSRRIGEYSKASLRRLIDSKRSIWVHLQGRDHYNRWLGVVYGPRKIHNLNRQMVSIGQAFYYSGDTKKTAIYKGAQRNAKALHRGVWSYGVRPLHPKTFRRRQGRDKRRRMEKEVRP